MRIRARFIGAVLAVAAVVDVAAHFYVLDKTRTEAFVRLRGEIADTQRLLRTVMAGPLHDRNLEQLNANLDAFFGDPTLVEIGLTGYEHGLALTRKREAPVGEGELLDSSVLITRGSDELGEVRLRVTTAGIERRLAALHNKLLLASAGLMLVLSGVIALVARSISRPVERLTEAARAMAGGRLDQRIDDRGPEEVTVLGESFARMRDAIREKIAALEEKNRQVLAEMSQRLRAEAELLRLYEEHRAITETVRDNLFLVDESGRLLWWNPSVERTTGIPREALSGRDSMEFFPEEDRPLVREALSRVLQTGHSELEARFLTVNGPTYYQFNGARVQDASGRVLGVAGVGRDVSERKRQEAALGASEERLRQAVRVADIGIFDHDHLTGTIYWSPEQRKIYGWGPGEAVTLKAYLDCLHPQDRERIGDAVGRARDPAGDGLYDVEHRVTRRDGSVRWLATRSQTFFDGEGERRRPVRTVGAVVDVTERKAAEAALRAAEERWARLFREAPQFMSLVRAADGTFVDLNLACERETGYTRAEAVGRTSLELGLWQDPARRQAAFAMLREKGEAHDQELVLRRRDGTLHHALFDAVTVAIAGEPCWLFIVRDITDRKRAEDALRESEQRFRALVELSSDWYWQTDERHRFTRRQGTVLEAMAVPLAEEYGKTPWEIGFFNMTEADWAEHRALLERREEFRDLLVERRGADGRIHWAAISGRPLFDAEGRFLGYHGTGRDITLQVRAEQTLREFNEALEQRVAARTQELAAANRELEAFSYSVSHDLRAPLRAIDGFAALLVEHAGPSLDAESHGYLERVRSGARRMGTIITDLLSLSKVMRSELRRRWVNLSEIARGIADELQRTAPSRQVEWRIEEDLYADADPGLVRVLLGNLLGNAWKYTGKKERAVIEFFAVRRGPERGEFCVRDNGAGFDMRHAGMLFRPFQRLHAVHEFEGTGIGLATVLRVVERHGGTVRGEGEPGRGASFCFSLPGGATR